MDDEFVKTVITYEGEDYDLRDHRFLDLTKEDKGKMIRVDEKGNIVLK